jgi:hypothetical protein
MTATQSDPLWTRAFVLLCIVQFLGYAQPFRPAADNPDLRNPPWRVAVRGRVGDGVLCRHQHAASASGWLLVRSPERDRRDDLWTVDSSY